MLRRKIEPIIRQRLERADDKVLVVTGARQVGKSYIIRHVGKQLFRNVIEVNLVEDSAGPRLFENVRTTDDFYITLSSIAGTSMGDASDTLVFLDEIQQYPHLLTLLKFLREENRFRYVASGSLLGVTLRVTTSVPVGSLEIMEMYPLDFREFLWADGFGDEAIGAVRRSFAERRSLDKNLHNHLADLFRRYLLVGGMPDAVQAFVNTRNLTLIRQIQGDIRTLYIADASKYDEAHRLHISRLYNLIPSSLENVKKRIVYKEIEGRKGSRASEYADDIDYLVSSGIALEVKAVSNPRFPLVASETKNLLKLYLNDVGLLSDIYYRLNISAILEDKDSINLGSLYECAVAQQLAANSCRLFYYDNKSNGEVDFLIDDYESLRVVPVEVKSGKDYQTHSALNRFMSVPDYHINMAYVLSSQGEIETRGQVVYMPVYMAMFLGEQPGSTEPVLI